MTAARADQTVADGKHGVADDPSNVTNCPTGREEFIAWLTASCQRQALPVTITDPTVLAAVAALLR
jgi:hypothetical protein